MKPAPVNQYNLYGFVNNFT